MAGTTSTGTGTDATGTDPSAQGATGATAGGCASTGSTGGTTAGTTPATQSGSDVAAGELRLDDTRSHGVHRERPRAAAAWNVTAANGSSHAISAANSGTEISV